MACWLVTVSLTLGTSTNDAPARLAGRVSGADKPPPLPPQGADAGHGGHHCRHGSPTKFGCTVIFVALPTPAPARWGEGLGMEGAESQRTNTMGGLKQMLRIMRASA